MGDLSDAEEEYKKALEFSPDDHMLHNNLGTIYFGLGRYDEAVREYEEAIRLNSEDVYARANLASVYAKQGKGGRAHKTGNRAKGLVPAPHESDGKPQMH